MFDYLSKFDIILVTGVQRSGTNIATRMIAHDLGYDPVIETEYGVHDSDKFHAFIAERNNIVIHCPAQAHETTNYAGSDRIAIVWMARDTDSIVNSMARIDWVSTEGARSEMQFYRVETLRDFIECKHDTFYNAVDHNFPNVFTIAYDDLKSHSLYIPKQKREHFTPLQTTNIIQDKQRILIATLGYREYGHAIASHVKARKQLADTGARFDWVYAYGLPDGLPDGFEGHDIVTRKYAELRELFLNGSWDVFIAIEDDMVIPEDTFTRLLCMLENGADVAYGLYCWRHNLVGGGWSAYTTVTHTQGISIVADPDYAKKAFDNKLTIDVAGVGLGCTAIARRVVETIPSTRRGKACNDWYFAIDAQSKGFTQRCDMGLVCGHMDLGDTPRIIYPDTQNMLTMQRIDYL